MYIVGTYTSFFGGALNLFPIMVAGYVVLLVGLHLYERKYWTARASKQISEIMKHASSRVLRELLKTIRDDEIAHHTMFQMVLRTYGSI